MEVLSSIAAHELGHRGHKHRAYDSAHDHNMDVGAMKKQLAKRIAGIKE